MKKEKGMTIVELIIVLIAIGILSAIIIPRFGQFSGFKLDSATQKLASHLRYAQQQAITTQATHQVALDTGNNKYSVKINRSDYLNLDSQAQQDYVDDGTSVWLKDAQSGKKIDVDLDGVSMTGTLTGANFNSLGGATLVGSGNVGLSYKGESTTITITESTGKVSIQ
jgi:prepilin-type N-terminal cleavage/methylation domain-containing protein